MLSNLVGVNEYRRGNVNNIKIISKSISTPSASSTLIFLVEF